MTRSDRAVALVSVGPASWGWMVPKSRAWAIMTVGALIVAGESGHDDRSGSPSAVRSACVAGRE
ncbi:hypothetical protein [Mycobacterium sp. 852013-50091_SCH5140682]|uniref:hypothetical protein n=1 Tax=Mycobacterium sp. 852013-50091_SCH5140682 TaxID=1834109 RepID=UPI000B1ACDAE|nr:hypothetical protein [Mycobacterium sp. 852013-50091_SCH5140682]